MKKFEQEQNKLFKLMEKQMRSIAQDIEASADDNGSDSETNVKS